MIDPPEIAQTEAVHTAKIHIVTPRSEMKTVMGPAFGELFGALASQGVSPAGPPFALHHKITDEAFDFDLAVPVARPITAVGRVENGERPAVRVARTVLHGGYEQLPEAWGALMKWIAAEGLAHAPWLWETYARGPESNPDPSTWRTELNRPLLP
ncbi:MAG: GyrI-like domain-containing protein [Polyangiales bacterium]